MSQPYHYLIAGAGIIGMSIAYELKQREPQARITIVEKESDVAFHASGRNSGVLHAGFYYSADSLKARFTVQGNQLMKAFCNEHGLYVNETQKVVVTQNSQDLIQLQELYKRAQYNGVNVRLIDEDELKAIDPNVKTYKQALYSPTTASVDPRAVCFKLKDVLQGQGVVFLFNTRFEDVTMSYDYLINAAGAYADKIAQRFNRAKNYTLLPFKGLYMKYMENKTDIKINVYPVPNLKNPFLGVHYTITYDNSIKIGPTAIPAFWRENYKGWSRFKWKECLEILYHEVCLFMTNAFNFRHLAIEEMKNYHKETFVQKAKKMVFKIGDAFNPLPAGIRAQLLDTKTKELVQDFVIEHSKNATHVLNAVSPAFTCSFAFAKYVADEIDKNKT